MATLKRLNKETGTYEIIPVGGGVPEAPEDGKQYVRKDGEWANLSIEPSSPFVNQEYADIVVNATGNNAISSGDYNKLSTWSTPVDDIYPYAETLFAGTVARMTIANTGEGIYAYIHMTQTATTAPLNTFFYLVEIKEDLTVTIKEQRQLVLDTSGDGTKFLANDGSYKEIESSEPFVKAEYGKMLKDVMESQSITQDNYNLLLNAVTSSPSGVMFCEYEYIYGRLYFMIMKVDSGDITIYMNSQMSHVPEPSFLSGALTISSDLTVTITHSSSITLSASGDGDRFLSNDGSYKEINITNSYTIDWLSFNSDTGTITQAQCDELWSAIESGKSIYVKLDNATPYGNLFCPVVISYGVNSSFLYIEFESHETNADEEWGRHKNGYVISKTKLTWTYKNVKKLITANDISLDDINRLRSYTTATTVASLSTNYESIYVNLTANASLSAASTGAAYNGRTITAYVYTAAAQTITIPTTGDYVSMCGSSFTTTAGGWVEFNLTCIDGKWHIAKLEQE